MRAIFLFVFVFFSACAPVPAAPDITVENARLKMPLPGQTTAVAYFDIVNTGGADILLSASSPVSPNVELHNHIHENGVMKMRRVESVSISKNTIVSFKPGGLHVMLFEADIKDGVYAAPMTLTFKKSGEKAVIPEITE